MNENIKPVPAVVIKRLPRYYRYLGELLNQGIPRISSGALSQKMGVTASQIRQDFNYFGGFGQQGYGYNIEYLYMAIGEILGLNNGYTTVIIGAGNMGRALATHDTFEKRGFRLIGIFDNNPELIGSEINGITITHTDSLVDFLKSRKPNIGILTVPKSAAQSLADILVEHGVSGILNFSYSELKTSKNIAIENVHLSDSLMTLSYKIKQTSEDK